MPEKAIQTEETSSQKNKYAKMHQKRKKLLIQSSGTHQWIDHFCKQIVQKHFESKAIQLRTVLAQVVHRFHLFRLTFFEIVQLLAKFLTKLASEAAKGEYANDIRFQQFLQLVFGEIPQRFAKIVVQKVLVEGKDLGVDWFVVGRPGGFLHLFPGLLWFASLRRKTERKKRDTAFKFFRRKG